MDGSGGIGTYKPHPLADIFPLMEGEPYQALVEDIREHGVREPIVMLDGMVLDGRNRYFAARDCGAAIPTVQYEGAEPLAYVVSLNLKRRHLNESQRAMVAAKIARLPPGRPSETAPIEAVSQDHAAELLNVGRSSVQRAREVQENATPALIAEVEAGHISVSAAAEVATLPEAEQFEIVARGEKEIVAKAKAIRDRRTEQKRAELVVVATRKPDLPTGRFGCIVIDPPWPMQKIERDVRPNQTAFDYPTMTIEEIEAFGGRIEEIAADDCHMFMWTTQKFLPFAFDVLAAWEWRYCLTMVWKKPGGFQPIGLPQYNCEFALYARRGSPKFVDTKAFPTCFEAPRREHSRKPDEFYELIGRVTDGPRIDVFSREARDGFEQFGNEAGKFAGAA